MLKINLTKSMSIPHEILTKYSSSRLVMRPAKGRGVIAGSSVRSVIELGGIKDISAKLLSRSKNPLNNARVALKALAGLSSGRKAPHGVLPVASHASK